MLIQSLPSAENMSLIFKARSDHKECLLQCFAHLADNRMFWDAFLKKSDSRAPTPASLSVGGGWGPGLQVRFITTELVQLPN